MQEAMRTGVARRPEHRARDLARRHGPFDLVMLEVGAYHLAWGDIHLGPDQAMEAHRLLGGGLFLPVHCRHATAFAAATL